MANDFFNASGAPSTGSSGSSSPIRSEFSAIAAAFDKLPTLAGNANKLVKINASATGLDAGGSVALTGGSIDDAAVNLDAGSLVLPQGTAAAPTGEGAVYWNTSTDTLTVGTGAAARAIVDVSSAQTLTNKTLASPSMTSPSMTSPSFSTISNGGTVTVPSGTATLLTSASGLQLSGGTMTGALLVPLGTAATPSVTFSGDTNTGIFSPGADQIALTTAGATRMSIDADGVLRLNHASARVYNSTSSAVSLEGTSEASSRIQVTRNSADVSAAQLVLGKSRGAAAGAVTAVISGDRLGEAIFAGADGSLVAPAASVAGVADGTPSANNVPGRLVFSTRGASGFSERLRIDSSGRMGLGTTTLDGHGIRTAVAVADTGGQGFGASLQFSALSGVTSRFANVDSAPTTAVSCSEVLCYTARTNVLNGTTGVLVGFNTESSFNSYTATARYAFRGQVTSATGNWNLYMDGQASNYLAGALFIGSNSDPAATNAELVIKQNLFNTAAIRALSDGVQTGELLQLHCASGINDQRWAGFYTEATASGTIRGSIDYNRSGGAVRYNTTSDYRLKDLFGTVARAVATIEAVPVHRGKMHGATDERPMFVAHELQAVAPYAVSGERDGATQDGTPIYQQVDHSLVTPLLWAAVQELSARVRDLESRLS